jgi:NADPH:quinone reductase-like Zn-dependent oxidoreductase
MTAETMKAIVAHRYGPPEVLQLAQVSKPVPRVNEVLIRVHATAVNAADWRLRKPDPGAVRLFFGLLRPRKKIMGGTVAGVVEATGPNVSRFKVGDRVFGSTLMTFGAYAEYVALPENAKITAIPPKLSFTEAAAIPFGAMTALHYLKKAGVTSGQRVLIIGASGAVGTAAVQYAASLGAEVTAVCSGSNAQMVRALGAQHVLDYTKPDFSLGESQFDIVYETVASTPFAAKLAALKPKGTLVMSDAGPGEMFRGIWTSITGKARVVTGVAKETVALMEEIAALVTAGKLKPVIDRTYPLEQMADAHRYAEGRHKKGNVVVEVG